MMVEKSPSPWHAEDGFANLFEPLSDLGRRIAGFFTPQADASATREEYCITIELPGVRPEDVDVSVHDNVVMVRGEKRGEEKREGRSYFFSERSYGAFYRTFRLPPDTLGEEISADFKDGLLTVRVPKNAAAKDAVRKIPVRKIES
jgi:HSP20 family protein